VTWESQFLIYYPLYFYLLPSLSLIFLRDILSGIFLKLFWGVDTRVVPRILKFPFLLFLWFCCNYNGTWMVSQHIRASEKILKNHGLDPIRTPLLRYPHVWYFKMKFQVIRASKPLRTFPSMPLYRTYMLIYDLNPKFPQESNISFPQFFFSPFNKKGKSLWTQAIFHIITLSIFIVITDSCVVCLLFVLWWCNTMSCVENLIYWMDKRF